MSYKMRAGKNGLGLGTRLRVEEIDAGAHAAYEEFLQSCQDAGDELGGLSVDLGVKNFGEPLALAITQRASGEDPALNREMLRIGPAGISPCLTQTLDTVRPS